jgi:hypothetical protein
MKRVLLVSAMLLVQACSPDEDCERCGDPEGGARPAGGLSNPCGGEAVSVALEWMAQSEHGSPSEVFGPAEGSCQAELTWDGAAFDDRSIEPAAGRTRVTVELTLDHASARWIEPRDPQGRPSALCGPYLEVDGHVTIDTENGTFRTQSQVTMRRARDSRPFTYGISQALAEHEGSLSIELRDGESGSLEYRIDGSGACAGEIVLTVSGSSNGMGWGGGGRFAQWSDTACPLGQTPFDLSESRGADGRTLPSLIEELWNDAVYAGTWRDGTGADLSLDVEVSTGIACNEQDRVLVPVRATYATSDGRLQRRTADATVNAWLRADGSPRQLDFWLSDDLVCANENDTLDYGPAECAEIERATVQLGFNYYGNGPPAVGNDGLHVYFAPRGAGEPPTGDSLEL